MTLEPGSSPPHKLTRKESVFVDAYVETWNADEAARRAHYKGAATTDYQILQRPHIQAAINEKIKQIQMPAEEVLTRLAQQARVNAGEFFIYKQVDVLDTNGNPIIDPTTGTVKTQLEMVDIDWQRFKEFGYLVKKLSFTRQGRPQIEFHDPQKALEMIGRANQLFADKAPTEQSEPAALSIPVDSIAPAFVNVYRDIRAHRHTEYLFFGGRGSTKSSFVSLVTIYLLVNNPQLHALATRQVANTLRDSVYNQLQWAIGELGLTDKFKCTTSPLEIEYLPTGQRIFFRGADDPLKIKSIKPVFGYIGILWFEELDSFHGPEQVRSIEQSVIRGGDEAYIFKNFNPPRTSQNWANKYVQIPKATQYQHKSDYTTVPVEWLGKTFLEEAEHLKNVNPAAYDHEYLGIVNGTGGQVFENVVIRKITDAEIAQFDRVTHGLDWGFYPDPAHYSRVHYDAARMTLYVFGEYRAWKMSNRDLYTVLYGIRDTEGKVIEAGLGVTPEDTLICDSAEPKSVADFREYGASARGAEKGPESVKYSMKWLASLKAIVIDNERCPYSAEEFLDYEFERTVDGDLIADYPDRANHAIDSVRYATNLTWRRRGQ